MGSRPIDKKGADRADGALYVVLFGAVILLWLRLPPIPR
jgi:hypothetical protein